MKEIFELSETLTEGAKSTNAFVGTFTNGISPAGKKVSLQIGQFFNVQSIVQIALSCILLPFALFNLWKHYESLNELKKRTFTENSHKLHAESRSPNEVNKNLISLKKMQLSSSATSILIALTITAVIVATLFTGGMALGVLILAALGIGTIKIGMDCYIAEKEKSLKIELFESQVLHLYINEHQIGPYKSLTPEDKTLYIAKVALDNQVPESEVKEYLLKKRQGYFENAKMRNAQLVLSALGMGLWLSLSFITAGIGGVITLGIATLLSVGLSIVNTETAQNLLGSKVTEWFRTIFSTKKDQDYELFDYRNRKIDNIIVDLKRNGLTEILSKESTANMLSIINKLPQNRKALITEECLATELDLGQEESGAEDPQKNESYEEYENGDVRP